MHVKRALLQFALGRHVLVRVPKCQHVCLTFDDGPNPDCTPKLLEVLDRHGVKGTFFMIGRELRSHSDIAREVVARGHELGNHTLTHPRMDRIANTARGVEIDAMDELLAQFDGRPLHFFRPPYGHMSTSLLRFCVGRAGAALAYWSRDSMDYSWSKERVVEAFRARPPRAGDVVLFHDDGDTAGQVLDTLLPQWKQQGLTFATLAEARALAA